MTIEKFRSTDFQSGLPMPRVITDRESARRAALASVTTHCGFCAWSGPEEAFRTHRCVNAAGRDLTEVKRAHAEGARRQYEGLNDWRPPPCMYCQFVGAPGAVHTCPGGSVEPLPHEVAANRFQRGSEPAGEQDAVESLVAKLKRAGYRLTRADEGGDQ